MAQRHGRIFACFEPAEPFVNLFSSRVQAGKLEISPGEDRVGKKSSALRVGVKGAIVSFVHHSPPSAFVNE